MALSVINKAPGVYIEEVQVLGPIAGVGTSTVAFIGPARRGPINKPTFLTSWSEFLNLFGNQDPLDSLGPYITAPAVYVTHAVRGFFDNGGKACYFVRVGTGARALRPLNDSVEQPGTPRQTLVVTAKQETKDGNKITVEVKKASVASSVAVVRGTANLLAPANNQPNNQVKVATADDAKKFLPGDIVSLEEGETKKERATIDRISDTTITFRQALTHTYTASGKMRIADLNPGQRRIRLEKGKTTDIEPGTYLSITQGTETDKRVVQSVERANDVITLAQGLTKLYKMAESDPPTTVNTLEFTLVIKTPGVEQFPNLSIDPRHSRYFANIVDSSSVDVMLVDPPDPTPPPANLPGETTSALSLEGGEEDDITKIQTTHYRNAIDALEKVDDVNILCIPDSAARQPAEVQEIQAYMIAHCEKMQDRFAILDAGPGLSPNEVRAQRGLISSDGGYAALYYPWVAIANPVGPGRITVPPSGHIAGVYARVDDTRGVHKAPANETMRGVLALERTLSDDEQGPLNEQGINVIRAIPGSGIRVWGARTIAPRDRTQWRFVNVRRLLLFIEESIQEGTQFAVFEPNDLALWGKLKRQVTDFLTRVWRDGALFGATADQAFRVRIDEELNPPDLRALGQLIIEVIVVPTTPAEFIVFRIISDTTGKALIQE
jgi:uncharacterized protein